MKQILTILTITLISVSWSQNLSPTVIASSGITQGNSSTILSYTIGESIIGSINSANNQIDQGFWHSANTITLSVNDFTSLIDLIAFPNPITNQLNIKISNANLRDFEIFVFDALGKRISFKSQINNNQFILRTSSWNAGVYFIQVQNTINNYSKSIKILKQ